MTPQHTLIIGAGRIGRALAEVISRGSAPADISLWDKNPQRIPSQLPLATLVPTADIIFCCTPSWTVRDVLTEIQPMLRPTTVVITLAKGCEASTGKTMAEVAKDILGDQPYGVFGGPMLAETLLSGHRGIGVIGSAAPSIRTKIVPLFADTPVEIQVSEDVYGVSMCGCLKNVYAFLVGMSTGSGWSKTDQQAFFAVAQQEFVLCGQALKIPAATLQGPAGLGDFLETSTSPASHNVQSGQAFAQKGYLVSSSEATISVPSILRRLKDLTTLPFIASLPAMLSGQQSIETMRQHFSTP